MMKPHTYFDDQQQNLNFTGHIPLLYVPFGILNKSKILANHNSLNKFKKNGCQNKNYPLG